MGTRVELDAALDQIVAARFGRPAVDRAKDQVRDAARELAPPAKTWITKDDDRVRPSHWESHGQTIPDNLRFKLPRQIVINNAMAVIAPGFDLAREPRDPNLPMDQRAGCRCVSVPIPGAVAATIHAGPTQVEGPRAGAEVLTEFNRAAESEFGTSEDTAARFMAGALRAVAARFTSASRPRR